jgi:FkbM family methyltransferase
MLSTRHSPDFPLRAYVDGVPEFYLDTGAEIAKWHRENSQAPNIEPFETQIFLKLLTDNPMVLDIGANIGWYSCVASAASHGKAKVIAFEPEPSNFTLLARNLALNGFYRVHAIQTALGSEDGRINLFLNQDNAGDHRIFDTGGRASLPVAIAKLDTIVGSDFTPNLIKIDVQGAEPLVLEGGVETLRRAGGGAAVLLEFYPGGTHARKAHALANEIFSFGRDVFVLYPYEGGQLQPITIDTLHSAIDGCIAPITEKYLDLLIAPNDGRMEKIQNIVGRDWQQW